MAVQIALRRGKKGQLKKEQLFSSSISRYPVTKKLLYDIIFLVETFFSRRL
jgi:hypothetical protein